MFSVFITRKVKYFKIFFPDIGVYDSNSYIQILFYFEMCFPNVFFSSSIFLP